MPKIRIHPRSLVFLFVLSALALALVQSHSHSRAQTNVCAGNIVSNGTFTGSMSPWSAAYGTPDWSAGQVGMWGNMNAAIGEGLKQTLTLVMGQTYNGTLKYRIVPGTDKQPDGRIRIRLGPAVTQWGVLNTIDLSNMTLASAGTWTTEPFSFTATATSQVLTINVENMHTANNGPDTSYGIIKDVCIQPAPAPTPGVPTSVCQGQPATFTGSAATSWNWNFGDGGTSTLQNPTHPYFNAGTFPVKLCVNGTTNCTIKNIVVNALPATPVITGPASSCGNQNATYSVPAVAGFTYSWTATNGTINGSSTGASVNVTWNATGVGVIAVTVTNQNGCSVTVRREVIGCDSHLPCCKDFFAKTDLKSLADAGNNIYNFTPMLSVNLPGPYVRVTADIIGANVTYSSPNCGKPGPITATIVGANPSNPGGFNGTIPITSGGEALWWSNSGANVNGVDFPMQIAVPPAPAGHCTQYVTICIKYTFTNKECKTCEVIRCYSFKRGGLIKDLTEFTEIKAEP
jgi:PKD repeat protein